MSRDPERAARHVAYKLGMLRTSLGLMERAGVSAPILESYLVHARNLIEFFWDGAPRGALLPIDFGAKRNRDKSPEIADLRNEISQLVSHLTWQRVEVHELRTQDWSLDRLKHIFTDVQMKAAEFLGDLPPEKREWFSSDAFPEEYRHWLVGDGS